MSRFEIREGNVYNKNYSFFCFIDQLFCSIYKNNKINKPHIVLSKLSIKVLLQLLEHNSVQITFYIYLYFCGQQTSLVNLKIDRRNKAAIVRPHTTQWNVRTNKLKTLIINQF